MSLLFVGDYANPNQPLWLSALTPITPPTNLAVTTLSVAPNGGISMQNTGPNTIGAPVAFERGGNAVFATQLKQIKSKQVPTKNLETVYVAATTGGGAIYDDMAMQGLQIYGPQVTEPTANSGCAGYLTRGDLPFSVQLYTGKFATTNIATTNISTTNISATNGSFSTINVSTGSINANINATTINATNFNGTNATFSTLNVSTGNFGVPDPLTVSTLIARQGFVSSMNTNEIVTSTISAQNFVLPGNAGFNNIQASTITAGIGNFSTLNAPSANIGVSTVAASTINTGLLSTSVAVAKEIFTSTMTFNASVSPNLDLGLGGIIGGLVGGFSANALSVGLGAAALGTGVAALTMARTSGGINPGIFQTVNGTTQLQFSTLGALTSNVFVTTDSATPNTTPGFLTSNVTFIPAGSLVVRSVSDPLNLPNASGAAGDGIQGFSEWAPVFPGLLQIQSNRMTSLLTGNSMDLGLSINDGITITPTAGRSTRVGGPVIASSFTTSGAVTGLSVNALNFVSTPIISNGVTPVTVVPGLTTSTISVSSFTVGTTVTSAIQTGTLGVTGVATVAGTVNTANATVTNNLTVQGTVALSVGAGLGVSVGDTAPAPANGDSLSVGDNLYCGSLNVRPAGPGASITSITGLAFVNGQPYPPTGPSGVSPVGTVVMYAGAVLPGGWLLCDGTAYSNTSPTYSALFSVINTAYGTAGVGTFCVPDLRTRTVFGASAPGFNGDTQPWVPTMGAVSFSQLQAEFSGTTVPNGTNGNGRGALAVKSLPVGYELQVGMRCQALAPQIDQGVHVIVAILNYNGGGGSYTNPNFPVLIINPPLTADTNANAQWVITPVNPYPYYLAQKNDDNFYTQITTDVPAHTHPVPEGGVLGNIGIDSNVPIGQPNVASPFTTGNPTTNFYYSVGSSTLGQPATVFTIGTSMNTRPSMVAMNYIIKF